MSFNWRSLVVLLAVAVLGGVVASQSTSSAQNQARGNVQWSYRVEASSSIEEVTLNQAGGSGWELVTVYEQDKGQWRAIFKKER